MRGIHLTQNNKKENRKKKISEKE